MIRLWPIALLCLAAALPGADPDPERAIFDTRLAALGEAQHDARVELARWARAQGLASEADALLDGVIAAAPDHPQARRLAGYELVAGAWLRGEPLWKAKGWVRYLGRWLPPSEQKRLVARRDALRKQLRERAGWESAWEAKTAHFAITSNCQVRVVEDIMVAMEQYYTAASRLFDLRDTTTRIPVEVFATQVEFARASARDGIGATENVGGYYINGRGLIRCWYAGSLDETLGTLFHETTHLIIDRFAKRSVPTWTNEGLAVYFEEAERLEDRVDPDSIPWTRLWHLRDMQKQGRIDLGDTVRRPHAGYTVEYYPRGWSLVHYLIDGEDGRFRRGFVTYLGSLRKGGDANAETLLTTALGRKPADLQDGWAAHVAAIEPKTARELAAAARAALGIYLDPRRAKAYGTQAIAADAEAWRSHAALARAMLAHARLQADTAAAKAAVAGYDRAVELARAQPDEILARIKRGQSRTVWTGLLSERMFALHAAGDGEGAMAAANGLLEVDETSAHAYAMLALLGAGEADQAAEVDACLATARDLGDDHLVRWCAARVAAARGQTDEAARLLAEAARLDSRGLGRAWYPAEAARLAGPRPGPAPGKAGNKGDGKRGR
jgi:hypothetical protein